MVDMMGKVTHRRESAKSQAQRWYGLDEAEKLLRVGDIGEALLAIGSRHLQSVTICNGLIALVVQPLFHDAPIHLRVGTPGQDGDHINDGEIPLFFGLVPCAAN